MTKTRKWVRKVKTVSTAPPKDLFTKNAQTIAITLARKLQYFINRGGKNLPETRKRELEKAKNLLQKKNAKSAK